MKTNNVILSPNVPALKEMPDHSIDLVYADPPFNTGRNFIEYDDGKTGTQETEVTLPEAFAWVDMITTEKERNYFAQIIPVMLELERLLKPTGAIYWHTDWRTTHYNRILLNQIFGKPAFRNEIVWTYKSTIPYDTIKHMFKNNYDTLLFYAKAEHVFNPQFTPLNPREIQKRYPYKDSQGRRYKHGGHDSTFSGKYEHREYADENKGSRMGTCWTDIDMVRQKERTGSPTQKPLKLLCRIIKASSNEGDIVLDPYCGSGTTLVAAQKLNRQFIGIDENIEAAHLSRKRVGLL